MEKKYTDFVNPDIEAIFLRYPKHIQRKMYDLREFILTVGAELQQVKGIEETLKWGEPSYITIGPKTGTTIRINCPHNRNNIHME